MYSPSWNFGFNFAYWILARRCLLATLATDGRVSINYLKHKTKNLTLLDKISLSLTSLNSPSPSLFPLDFGLGFGTLDFDLGLTINMNFELLFVSILVLIFGTGIPSPLLQWVIHDASSYLSEDMPLGHNGQDEGILAVGELTRLVRVLPGVIFLK